MASSRWPRGLLFVLLTLGIDALGFGIVVPIVPALVKELTGGDTSRAAEWVGALIATFSAAQFVAAPVLGGLSDRYGRRPVIILSLLGGAANYLLLAWAPSIAWLFLGRVLAGATAANFATATAYVADISEPATRSQRFGLVGATFGAGFVFGPALGGVLGAYGLRWPFLVAGALALANACYGAWAMPESLSLDQRRPFSWRRANPIGSLNALLAARGTRWLSAAWALLWFGLGALQSTLVLYTGLRFGWGSMQNGYALAALGVCQAVVQGALVRPVIARVSERGAAIAGLALSAASYLCFGGAWAGWVIYPAVLLQALGSVANPALRALLSANVGPERQGELQGGLSSVQGLTSIVAPELASLVFSGAVETGGAAWAGAPFLLSSVIYVGAVLTVLRSAVRPVAQHTG